MPRRHRSDLNQSEVVKNLRARGLSVAVLSQVGDDFPDLALGGFGVTALCEVKSPFRSKRASERRSEGQVNFASAWRGSRVLCGLTADEIYHDFMTLVHHYANPFRDST